MTEEPKRHPWKTSELTKLRRLYPIVSYKCLEKEFYPHPLGSIKAKGREMGMRRPRRMNNWKKIIGEYKPVIFSVHRVPASHTENKNDRELRG